MIPIDKRLHLEAGFIITAIMGLIFGIHTGLLAGVLSGIGKEVWDEYKFILNEHPSGFDSRDMFSTWVGTFLGGLIL